MDNYFIKAIQDILSSSSAILLFMIGVVISIFGLLLPVFVFRIMKNTSAMNHKLDELIKLQKNRF